MIKKKIQTISIGCLMLLAVLTIIPTVQAIPSISAVKGTIYIDGSIAEPGIEIEIHFYEDDALMGINKTTTFEYDGFNFNIGFEGHEGEKGYFRINDQAPEEEPEPYVEINNDDTYYYIGQLNFSSFADDLIPPSKVTGLTVTDAKDGKLNLEWNPATDNVEVDFYNIYSGEDDYSEPLATVTHPTTTYQDTDLTNGQTYCYKVSAVDTSNNEGEMPDEICASPSKTSTPPSPPEDDDDNDTPTGDNDGDTPTGDDNDTGDEIIPNKPPEMIEFTGNETGNKNTALSYYATATDPDGHDVKYIFDWDDGNENETEFVANGTQYNITHIFTTAGIYDISVHALDDYAEGGSPSAKEYLQVLIDTHIIDDTENDVNGYLTDDDGDGAYDNFYNYDDENTTAVNYDSTNEIYLIDTTNDGEYNYRYNPNTGEGELIEEDPGDDTPADDVDPEEENNTLLYVGAVLLVIILLLLFFLLTRKKGKK
jgi:hypothetical protein